MSVTKFQNNLELHAFIRRMINKFDGASSYSLWEILVHTDKIRNLATSSSLRRWIEPVLGSLSLNRKPWPSDIGSQHQQQWQAASIILLIHSLCRLKATLSLALGNCSPSFPKKAAKVCLIIMRFALNDVVCSMCVCACVCSCHTLVTDSYGAQC